jgi:hypothetical protein
MAGACVEKTQAPAPLEETTGCLRRNRSLLLHGPGFLSPRHFPKHPLIT